MIDLWSWLVIVGTPLFRFLFKYVFLFFYDKYLILKKRLNSASTQKSDKILFFFTNRYLLHALLLLLGLSVVTSNIMAQESRDNYGQSALIYRLAGIGDLEIIEDVNVLNDDIKNYNYQDTSVYIEGSSFVQDDGIDQDDVFTDQDVVVGDLAIIKPDIISTGEAKSTIGRVSEYIVQDGDTISKIARKYGVSVETILWANNLSFSSYVKPGQKLLIPSMSGVVYKVAKGDTLSKISLKYGIAENKIIEANNLADDMLTVGNILLIPGARIIETAKPKAVATSKTKTPSKTNYQNDQPVVSSGKMFWPSSCQRISQYYKGWIHTGVDIACPWGSALRAAEAGRVSRVQYGKTGYGYNVIIDHGGGVQTLYAHMSAIDVSVGDYVARGQIIGAEGSTGRSTGPHVHFEVRINGSYVNPLNYIR